MDAQPTTPPTTQLDRQYLDRSLPIDTRVENLLSQMTLAEKAGLMFHPIIAMNDDGTLSDGDATFAIPSTHEYIVKRQLTHFNILSAATSATTLAEWHNRLQELAQTTRLGIPVTISTDPRHSYSDNPLAGLSAGAFSVWPEPLGLAATRDPATVEAFAQIARQEYTAVGIRVALHPQIDLATDPRWARAVQTFGEDVELTSALARAYIRGFQGEQFGIDSVSTMAKHFPGGGPQKDGEDPHFDYGREQVYPGGQFELHLKPFEAAFDAGVRQIMPYYGMPIGTAYEELGFGFNRSVITGLLRERYGFDGVVCTDWTLVNDTEILGQVFPARAWGVEHLSPRERMKKIIDAGCDQFGGEATPDLLVSLVNDGEISEDRIDISVRRLLREKFMLGLFDERRFVDVDTAARIVGNPEFVAAGVAAQRASLTLLTNQTTEDGSATLPLTRGARIYIEGIEPTIAAEYAEIVGSPEEADVAIVRTHAPYEQRATVFENFFHAGSLDFSDEQINHLHALTAQVPTVLDIFLDRPAILTPLVDAAASIIANYGVGDRALLDVLFGQAEPQGHLPFDLPRTMAAVEASRPDVPFDTEAPLFRCGHGLGYSRP